jgi:excisionase family DNA binding protein
VTLTFTKGFSPERTARILAELRKQLLTVPEAAACLRKSDRTVRRVIKAGKLRVIPWGGSKMIHSRELERILREGF